MGTEFAALFVGVNQYDRDPRHFWNLGAPTLDAEGLRAFYGTHFAGPENVFLLVEAGVGTPSPTLADLRIAIKTLKMGRPKAVLLFFSGHGVELAGKPYLALSDALISAGSHEGIVALDELMNEFKFAETVALILDACRCPPSPPSWGKPHRDKSLTVDPHFSAPALQAFTSRHANVAILSSCSSGERSYETEEGGKFTIALLTALDELVTDRQAVVGQLLRDRAHMKFRDKWPDTPQNPHYYYSGNRPIEFVPTDYQKNKIVRVVVEFVNRVSSNVSMALGSLNAVVIAVVFLAVLLLGTQAVRHSRKAPTPDFVHDEAGGAIRQFQEENVPKSTGDASYNSFTDERLRQWHEQGEAAMLAQAFIQRPDGSKLIREVDSLSPVGRDKALAGLELVSRPTFAEVGEIRQDGSAQTEAGQQAERELAREIVRRLREATSGLLPRLFWWLYNP